MKRSLSGKNVLVIGLGLHGGAIGTIQWLAAQGATISVSDTKSKEELAPSIIKLQDVPNITYYFGNQDDVSLDNVDMVIRNPGVPRTASIIQRAKEKNIPIEMDSSLFFEQCGPENIIGITGSKGKTTASSAISAVMKAIHAQTLTVGVDGVSPLGALISRMQNPLQPSLKELRPAGTPPSDSPVVFELSSWRLEALQEKNISPHIAVVTSIYKDHLNTYASYEEYINTKKQIILDQTADDITILNRDDAILKTWTKDVQGNLYWFSLEKLQEDQQGIWVEGGKIFANVNANAAPTPSLSHNWERESTQTICSVSDIPHNSPHELRNKLPAILLGILHGVAPSVIVRALQNAPELKHRLQFVRTVDGVRYINDSAATMPDATIAAIESYGNKPLILILGGSDKALEFENLAECIASHKNIWHIIWLPGTATANMKERITPATKATHHKASNMKEAVQTAHSLVKVGDTVLLSPGATSFGLFLHEFDRGDAFIKAVEEL